MRIPTTRNDGRILNERDINELEGYGFSVLLSEETVVMTSTQPYYYLRDEPVEENNQLRKKIYEKPKLEIAYEDILSEEDITINSFPAIRFTYTVRMEVYFVEIESLTGLGYFLFNSQKSYCDKSNVLNEEGNFHTALVLGR